MQVTRKGGEEWYHDSTLGLSTSMHARRGAGVSGSFHYDCRFSLSCCGTIDLLVFKKADMVLKVCRHAFDSPSSTRECSCSYLK